LLGAFSLPAVPVEIANHADVRRGGDLVDRANRGSRRRDTDVVGSSPLASLIAHYAYFVVALKVLPFAATMDQRQMQRFQNEARAAASLQHPHIVPVHAVGCERGVHYYAMQFIDGQSLASLIEQQRTGASNPATALPTTDSKAGPANATVSAAAATTGRTPYDAAYFRRAAEWGIQAAEALEHAHSVGIVHRDIKPANLMIDGNGSLWVTDFGLARTAADAGITMTGDVLGTLRYMSPEQALAKHGLVDHRTDVYSLGVTLYELLTGKPAADGKDREEILNHITLEEPRQPRSFDSSISRDLETVVLKAMARFPRIDSRRHAHGQPNQRGEHRPSRRDAGSHLACVPSPWQQGGDGVHALTARQQRREREAARVEAARACKSQDEGSSAFHFVRLRPPADRRLAQPPGRAARRPGGPRPGRPAQRGPAPARLPALRPARRLPLLAARHRLQPHGRLLAGARRGHPGPGRQRRHRRPPADRRPRQRAESAMG